MNLTEFLGFFKRKPPIVEEVILLTDGVEQLKLEEVITEIDGLKVGDTVRRNPKENRSAPFYKAGHTDVIQAIVPGKGKNSRMSPSRCTCLNCTGGVSSWPAT